MIQPGTQLAHYEIVSVLGKGGMGEVWRARDTRLGREVAIKTLPTEFAEDQDRMARFGREAQVLASLNHPNIAAIYGMEEHEGIRFIVQELVEGETLAARIDQGPVPLDDSLGLASQMAAALEAAHDAGVIHRDLKPANIKVTDDGRVKVLDFGLAKASESTHPSSTSASESPTITTPAATGVGVILGTAAYMSPEQARGRPVDRRADIWAFGCVFYEMLTGTRVFDGDDLSDTLADVLRSEPTWDRLPRELPVPVRTYLKRCLVKDPKSRVRDIGDMRLALEGAFDDGSHRPGPDTGDWRQWGSPVAAALSALLVAALVAWQAWPVSEPEPTTRFEYPIPAEHEFGGTFLVGRPVAVSPQGRHIAYTSPRGLYLHPLNAFDATLLVENTGDLTYSWPFFSPDGNQVGFLTPTGLKAVGIGGGTPISLDDSLRSQTFGGADWGPDGDTITLATVNGIEQMSVGRPETRRIVVEATPGERLYSPQVLPGGRAVLFVSGTGGGESGSIQIGLLASGERLDTQLLGTNACYLETGHLVFGSEERLLGVEFDLDRLSTEGTPVFLGIAVAQEGLFEDPTTLYSVSDGGTLAFFPPFSMNPRRLRWFSRSGEPLETVGEPTEGIQNVALSPNERYVLFHTVRPDRQVRRLDLQRNVTAILTPVGGDAIFSASGDRVAFDRSPLEGTIVSIPTTGGPETVLFTRPDGETGGYWVEDWSADETTLIVLREEGGNGQEAVLITVGSDRPPEVLDTALDLDEMHFAPNERWIAYNKDETGDGHQVFVTPYPPTGRIDQVSLAGGVQAVWRADGRELFYIAPDGMLMSVSFDPETGESGIPVEVFNTGLTVDPDTDQYAVSNDGQRFLLVETLPIAESDRPRIAVIENWLQELPDLVSRN